MKKIKLNYGKHFYGECGSSNFREAGEIFDAEIKEREVYGITSIVALIQTPFMQHPVELVNDKFRQEFTII